MKKCVMSCIRLSPTFHIFVKM